MFDALAKGFKQARNRLAGLTELTEQNIETALREVRLVAARGRRRARRRQGVPRPREGEGARRGRPRRARRVSDGQTREGLGERRQFVKICHDELVAFMSPGEGPAHRRWRPRASRPAS